MLSPSLREVVVRYYGIGRPPETLAAIGRSRGVTREAIRQSREKALAQMRSVVRRLHIGK